MYINISYQVLFRYALAILKYIEEKLLRQNDYMSIFSTFRTEVESLSDVKRLTQVRKLYIIHIIYYNMNIIYHTHHIIYITFIAKQLKLKFKFYTVLDELDQLTATTSSLPKEETTKLYFNGLQYKGTKDSQGKEYDHLLRQCSSIYSES